MYVALSGSVSSANNSAFQARGVASGGHAMIVLPRLPGGELYTPASRPLAIESMKQYWARKQTSNPYLINGIRLHLC